jgi:hypothetical protein
MSENSSAYLFIPCPDILEKNASLFLMNCLQHGSCVAADPNPIPWFDKFIIKTPPVSARGNGIVGEFLVLHTRIRTPPNGMWKRIVNKYLVGGLG